MQFTDPNTKISTIFLNVHNLCWFMPNSSWNFDLRNWVERTSKNSVDLHEIDQKIPSQDRDHP